MLLVPVLTKRSQYLATLPIREHSRERGVLPQLNRDLINPTQHRGHTVDTIVKEMPPLVEIPSNHAIIAMFRGCKVTVVPTRSLDPCRWLINSFSVELESRETLDDFHGLEADCCDPFDQIHDIAWIVVFEGPVIGVVDDAGSFVDFDLVTVDDPVQC